MADFKNLGTEAKIGKMLIIVLAISLVVSFSGCVNMQSFVNILAEKYKNIPSYRAVCSIKIPGKDGNLHEIKNFIQLYKKPNKLKTIYSDGSVELIIGNETIIKRYYIKNRTLFSVENRTTAEVVQNIFNEIVNKLEYFNYEINEEKDTYIIKLFPKWDKYVSEKIIIDKSTWLPLRWEDYIPPGHVDSWISNINDARIVFEKYFGFVPTYNKSEDGYIREVQGCRFEFNVSIPEEEFNVENLYDNVRGSGWINKTFRMSSTSDINLLQEYVNNYFEEPFEILLPKYVPENCSWVGWIEDYFPEVDYGPLFDKKVNYVTLNYLDENRRECYYIAESNDPLLLLAWVPSGAYIVNITNDVNGIYEEYKSKSKTEEGAAVFRMGRNLRFKVGKYYIIIYDRAADIFEKEEEVKSDSEVFSELEKEVLNLTEMVKIARSMISEVK